RSARLVGGPGLRSVDGFEVEYFAGLDLAGDAVAQKHVETVRVIGIALPSTELVVNDWSMRIRGRIRPPESGTYQLALAQNGRARVFVDGTLVVDGFTDPPPPGGTDF